LLFSAAADGTERGDDDTADRHVDNEARMEGRTLTIEAAQFESIHHNLVRR
jgi:hypothetical protein